MKTTKEITTGAMLLAIFGVVLLIDRSLSYLFNIIVPLVESVVIIIYGNKYGLKNGLIFSVAVLIISFVLVPDPRYLYFILLGAISASVFNFLLSKGSNSFTLILSIMAVYSIGELLDILFISYIFYKESFYQIGVETASLVNEMIQSMNGLFPPETINMLSSVLLNEAMVSTVLIISCIITGIMEGLIIYIVSVVLFKRFKINVNIGFDQIVNLKPSTAYILFGFSCLVLFNRFYYHPVITPILSGLSLISMFVLAYYGYIYVLILYRTKYNKRNPFILVLLILLMLPLAIIVLFFVGFLYGTGPLKKYLFIERKQDEQN